MCEAEICCAKYWVHIFIYFSFSGALWILGGGVLKNSPGAAVRLFLSFPRATLGNSVSVL